VVVPARLARHLRQRRRAASPSCTGWASRSTS
jgi:hypothetical protein